MKVAQTKAAVAAAETKVVQTKAAEAAEAAAERSETDVKAEVEAAAAAAEAAVAASAAEAAAAAVAAAAAEADASALAMQRQLEGILSPILPDDEENDGDGEREGYEPSGSGASPSPAGSPAANLSKPAVAPPSRESPLPFTTPAAAPPPAPPPSLATPFDAQPPAPPPSLGVEMDSRSASARTADAVPRRGGLCRAQSARASAPHAEYYFEDEPECYDLGLHITPCLGTAAATAGAAIPCAFAAEPTRSVRKGSPRTSSARNAVSDASAGKPRACSRPQTVTCGGSRGGAVATAHQPRPGLCSPPAALCQPASRVASVSREPCATLSHSVRPVAASVAPSKGGRMFATSADPNASPRSV